MFKILKIFLEIRILGVQISQLDTDKILEVLSHVKFADCKIDFAALPINIWFADNVVTIPPREIAKVPEAALPTF